jgi:hypothetical protein
MQVYILLLLTLLNGKNMAQRNLTTDEIQILQEALSADYKDTNIRLREGEYPYTLAGAIASFQLELHLPDIKDIVKALYGEEKANDVQFIRKIQTILKKMQKSHVVRIVPKKTPWNLQRYALMSFKFQDIEKNSVVFAMDEQIKQAQDMLRLIVTQRGTSIAKRNKINICVLAPTIAALYITSVWALISYVVNPIIFLVAFSIAVVCSIILGRELSQVIITP